MQMDVSYSRYLRLHDDYAPTLHRSLDQTRGAIYSTNERGSHLIVVVGIIMMFMLVFFAANSNCGYRSSSSSERSDDSLPPSDPHRLEEMEANLFSGKVAAALQPRSNNSSALVFQPRQPTEDEECPICCNNFSQSETYCIVKTCNHLFHRVCIEQWVIDQEKDICPVCRSEVITCGYACKEIEMTSRSENNQPST